MAVSAGLYGSQEQVKALFAAMAKMQGGRDDANVKRDAVNPHFKKSYETLAAVLEAGLPAAAKSGLSLIWPSVIRGGELVQLAALCHEEGGYWVAELPVNPVRNDPQGMKSAQTYTKRMLALQLLCLAPADDDDDGNEGARGQPPAREPPRRQPARQEQRPQRAPPPEPQPDVDWRQAFIQEFAGHRKRLGDHVYRTIVPKGRPKTADEARRLLDTLRQSPTPSKDDEALKLLEEAREETDRQRGS